MIKKILIIDDSALMRRLISDIIESDSRYKVEDVAPNGLEALTLIIDKHSEYDAAILDINMPKMNGLELLEKLQKLNIKMSIIVVSTVAKEGAMETIRALELGAFDFVTKPESFIEAKSDDFKNGILKCLALATNLDKASRVKTTPKTEKDSSKKKASVSDVSSSEQKDSISQEKKHRYKGSKSNAKKLVALACSTGGPKALQHVIPFLPKELDSSMLIVQHMPVGFTNSLAIRLNELSKIQVKEAEDGEIIKNGVVYIAKGGSQMRLVKSGKNYKLALFEDEPAREGLKPCANIMYESLIDSDFDEITCVVLTGMGSDGTEGIRKLGEKKNIYVIAQDEETSTVYGMPKVVTTAGLTDEIVAIKQISDAIIKNVGVQ